MAERIHINSVFCLSSRYRALENKMEETMLKSSEIRAERIQALESRLEESKSRNGKLAAELQESRRSYEALQQRMEEELSAAGNKRPLMITQRYHGPNTTKEILELKDHLVKVERAVSTLGYRLASLYVPVVYSGGTQTALGKPPPNTMSLATLSHDFREKPRTSIVRSGKQSIATLQTIPSISHPLTMLYYA